MPAAQRSFPPVPDTLPENADHRSRSNGVAAAPRQAFGASTPASAPTPARGHNTEDFLRPTPAEGVMILSPPRAPVRIESLAQVSGWLSTAKTARSVGELCCAFLASRFDRVLVADLRHHAPIVLASTQLGREGQGVAPPAVVHALQTAPMLLELAGRREAYYGPAMTTPEWMQWFGSIGGSVPGAMFVGGLGRAGQAAFLFYADHRDITLRPMVKDTVVLLREAAAALSVIG